MARIRERVSVRVQREIKLFLQWHVANGGTVEPILKDPLAKGRCIKYVSTRDSTLVTKIQFLM